MDANDLKLGTYILLKDGRLAKYLEMVKAPGSNANKLQVLVAGHLIETTVSAHMTLMIVDISEHDWDRMHRSQQKAISLLKQALEILEGRPDYADS